MIITSGLSWLLTNCWFPGIFFGIKCARHGHSIASLLMRHLRSRYLFRMPYLVSEFQRFCAAFFAISARRSGVIFSARAFPPRLPIDTAAGSLPCFSGVSISSSISPVAILATLIALPITSAGRFSPLGPLGMRLSLQIYTGQMRPQVFLGSCIVIPREETINRRDCFAFVYLGRAARVITNPGVFYGNKTVLVYDKRVPVPV